MPGPESSPAEELPTDPDAPIDLGTLGWDARWAQAFAPHIAQGLSPARVAIEFNHIFRLYTATGERRAQHSGRLLHTAEGRHALAAVGDWVAIRTRDDERSATIEAILPRRSHFSRKAAGELTEQQVVAANIDVVFLVMGLDRDYNPRRMERYLMLAGESGATPHILLSKADLATDVDASVAEIRAIAPGVAVDAVSVRDRRGVDRVEPAIGWARTGALLGSSGAGKSTLINHLLGHELLATAIVRPSDSRGRHTTRHRQLVRLLGGGLLIDTPGMRELQLWTTPEGAETSFDDIEALAPGCQFSDCRHRSEPRCAVTAAVADGRLAASRLESFHRLGDEAGSLAARQDVRDRTVLRAQSRSGARAMRELYRSRDRS